jgi:hypothetical protein
MINNTDDIEKQIIALICYIKKYGKENKHDFDGKIFDNIAIKIYKLCMLCENNSDCMIKLTCIDRDLLSSHFEDPTVESHSFLKHMRKLYAPNHNCVCL